MRTYHQVFNNWDDHQKKILKEYGLDVPLGFHNIKLYDADLFNNLNNLFKQWGVMVAVGSDFSNEEYASAHHLMVLPKWQTQYPQPEDNFAYLDETYDLVDYCTHCGCGASQKNPFRITKEIKWGKRSSFILNWVFDEIFVRSDVYEKVFLPYGIQSMPVLLDKTGRVLENVKQLKISTACSSLELEGFDFEVCEKCNRKKFAPITSGFFPKYRSNSEMPPMQKSQEYYGSGGVASKWIVVSQTFRKMLLREHIDFSYFPSDK